MRVLFLSLYGTYPFEIGGPQNVAYHLVKELKDKELDIDFAFGITRKHFNSISYSQFYSELSNKVNLIPIIKNHPKSIEVNHPWFWRQLAKLAVKVGKNKPMHDVIHFNGIPNTRDLFVPALSKLRKIPTVYSLHGWVTYETSFKRNCWPANVYNFFTFKLLCRSFSIVVCNSHYMKHKAILEGIKAANIKVIPNGVDLADFQNQEAIDLKGAPKLLFVGRLEYEKGIDILLRSVKSLRKSMPDIVLHIVGTGSMERSLKVMAESVKENVFFHGYVPAHLLPRFYRASDIYVHPSRYEPFGISIIEAMAAGQPIIASKVGGIPEIVKDNENGILIKPNVIGLAKSLKKLWHNKQLMHRISENNQREAEKYGWKRIVDQYVRVYKEII